MKAIFTEYAAYNAWANERLINAITALTPEQHHQEIKSSFPTIYLTVQHLWQSENVWQQRLRGGQIIKPEDHFNQSMEELGHSFVTETNTWEPFIETLKEERLEEILSYVNMRGTHFSIKIRNILLHVFNHSTYHRGQLVTMLRETGITTIPGTDFSAWSALSNKTPA